MDIVRLFMALRLNKNHAQKGKIVVILSRYSGRAPLVLFYCRKTVYEFYNLQMSQLVS